MWQTKIPLPLIISNPGVELLNIRPNYTSRLIFATPAPTPAPEMAFGDEPSHRVSTETMGQRMD